MAGLNLNKFISSIVAVIVAVILLVALAIPILMANKVDPAAPNADVINTLLGIIPLLIAVGVILAVIYLFVTGKRD